MAHTHLHPVATERLSHNAIHFPHHVILGLPDIVFPKRQIYRLFMMYKRQGFKKNLIFSKEESLGGGGGGFLPPLLAGLVLPVPLISPSPPFVYLLSPSCKPAQGVQPKPMRFYPQLRCNLTLTVLPPGIIFWVTWPENKLDVGRGQNVRLEEFQNWMKL